MAPGFGAGLEKVRLETETPKLGLLLWEGGLTRRSRQKGVSENAGERMYLLKHFSLR